MELNKVTLDSTIGEIKRSFNDGVLDAFGEVAAALKAEADRKSTRLNSSH